MDTKRTYLDYMDKTYLEELNYKIWSTKGARFQAHQRLSRTARLSMISSSLLNAYLIVAGLLSVYNIYNESAVSDNLMAYVITSLSILLLVFTQVEGSKRYEVRAKEFHDCALALSRLYDQLRIFKTPKTNTSEKEKISFAEQLTDKYEDILARTDNHHANDFNLFRTKKPDYHLLKPRQVWLIKARSYFTSYFFYHLLIGSPVVVGMVVWVWEV
ncbi:MAG: SLATT domain-containing protein [Marinoscillum sp.]